MEEKKRVRKTKVTEPVIEEPIVTEPTVEEVVNEEPTPVVEEKKEEPYVAPEDRLIRWRKIGTGIFVLNNHHIKPNQIFTATIRQIPTAFRDLVIPLEELPTEITLADAPAPSNYTLHLREDGLYDVLDKNNKRINENPMSGQDASALQRAL